MNFLKNNFAEKINLSLYLLILFAYFCAYIFVSVNIPVDADGALHASTVEVMAQTGTLLDYHPFTLTEGSNHLPIFYPKLFYTLMTIIATLIGKMTYFIIVPSFGILTGLFIYLLAASISKKKYVGIIASIVCLSSYGVATNSVDMFRMETMVILLLVASTYCLYRFSTTGNISFFICSIIFTGASLATKQLTYMVLPLFAFAIFALLEGTLLKKFKYVCTFYLAIFLIASPLLIKEFLSTGTLFYPGVPFVGKIEKQIADIFHIKLYSTGEGWSKYAVGSDRIIKLKDYFSSPESHLVFLNPFSYIESDITSSFFLLLVGLGSILLILRRFYFLLIFLASQQLILFVQPLERYFILNQVLSTLIIGCSAGLVEAKKFKISHQTRITIVAFLIVSSILSIGNILYRSYQIPDYSWQKYVPGRLKSNVDAGVWLHDNSPKDSVIITPRTHVTSYYSYRDTLWINQLGGEQIYEAFLQNDVEKIHRIGKTYKNSYILIPDFWVVEAEAEGKWISFVERKTVDLIGQKKDYFEKVYDNKQILIYKII